MTLDDLGPLPCPFCSHEQSTLAEFRGKQVRYAVQCDRCNACGPFGESPEQAIVGWYMRDGEMTVEVL